MQPHEIRACDEPGDAADKARVADETEEAISEPQPRLLGDVQMRGAFGAAAASGLFGPAFSVVAAPPSGDDGCVDLPELDSLD